MRPSQRRADPPRDLAQTAGGAWADRSSWNRVTSILQQHGHNVVAVQLPLTSLAEDVAWTRHVLAERLQGPTVLAGHSYGGAVISGAATGVLVSTRDRMINPDLLRFMADRIGATTVEVRSSHASPVSHPHQVARLILAAARVGTRA
jgi:pimeloyl-ACP methyl ester carboxylesterase